MFPIRSKLISIHALREEGDLDCDLEDLIVRISIHALREEGDTILKSPLNLL